MGYGNSELGMRNGLLLHYTFLYVTKGYDRAFEGERPLYIWIQLRDVVAEQDMGSLSKIAFPLWHLISDSCSHRTENIADTLRVVELQSKMK